MTSNTTTAANTPIIVRRRDGGWEAIRRLRGGVVETVTSL